MRRVIAAALLGGIATSLSVHPIAAETATGKAAATGASADTVSPRTLRADDLRGLTWRSVGPANMGGRVADIALAPSDPKTFYIAYATGGLFKTTNNGTTFAPVFDKYETSSIGAVVVADAPEDWPGWSDEEQDDDGDDADDNAGGNTGDNAQADRGRSKIVWVGTGESNGRNSSSWGHGVYRSTDGGATFTHLGLEATHDIARIAVDPRNPDVCYVAAMGHLWGRNTERGLYKTTDGGATWSAVLRVDDATGCCDVILDPANPDRVFAAMYTRLRTPYSFNSGSDTGGIFRSDDGGTHWKKLTDGLPAETGRIGLDICRHAPQIMMATIESDSGGRVIDAWHNFSRRGGVFRSEDGGDHWKRVSHLNPRAFYFSKIRIDPDDDQRVYLLGWNVGVSDDGGRHFRANLAKIAHVDMHAMVIDPSDTDHLIIGNDGGAYVSYDRGGHWDFLNQMAVGQFYNVAVDLSDPYRIGGGLQDNGSWVGPSATLHQSGSDSLGEPGWGITNADWWFVNDGDGFHVAFDPTDGNIIYAESQGGMLVRVNLANNRRKILVPAPKEGQPRFRFNWNAPFFISPHDATTLYLGGNYVFKLTDRGDRWRRISDDLSTGDLSKMITVGSDAETFGTVVALAESPVQQGRLWAGTDDGRIHVTTDDGATWTDVTPTEVGGRYVSRIAPSNHDRDTAYASIDGHRNDDMAPHVLVTEDLGQTWRLVTGDLPPDAPVKVVGEDIHNRNVLYAGTEHGAYVTIDRGDHWVRLNGESLPTVPVDDLVQHPREMDLVAGTHGRSVWVLDDASPLSQLDAHVLAADLHLFDLPAAKPRVYMPYSGLWSHAMFRAKNPPMGARISYWINHYSGEPVKITITDDHDVTIRTLEGTNRPGINRVIWDLQYDKDQRYGNPESWLGQTRFVPAGQYTVTVRMKDTTVKGTLTVLKSPIRTDP